MDLNMLIIYVACIIGIFIIGKIFIVPLKVIFRLMMNSLLGVILLYIINLIGGIWRLHIGINAVTAVIVGILGIPGAVLLTILKAFVL